MFQVACLRNHRTQVAMHVIQHVGSFARLADAPMRFVNLCMELMTFLAPMHAGPPTPAPALAWHMSMISRENSRLTTCHADNHMVPNRIVRMLQRPHKRNLRTRLRWSSQLGLRDGLSKESTSSKTMRKEGAHVITKMPIHITRQ